MDSVFKKERYNGDFAGMKVFMALPKIKIIFVDVLNEMTLEMLIDTSTQLLHAQTIAQSSPILPLSPDKGKP